MDDNYEIDNLAEMPWEETLEFLTSDMDPESIDICVLTDRYQEYIDELEEFDLEVPAQAIRLCAALLRIKTMALTGEQIEEETENPMDFEDGEMMEEEFVEEDGPDIEVGPDLEMPVKAKPRRRMSLDELTAALEDAMEVKQKREERQELREEMEDPVGIDEKSLEEKVNSLFSKVTDLISGSSDKIPFNQLVDDSEGEEKIEKFLHVLHLENERKVECIQEEWLGDLEVKPKKEPEQVAN
jgi:chromatin segregation and condensation protein Rec8/ScpA/Scc1 (kleisin family)